MEQNEKRMSEMKSSFACLKECTAQLSWPLGGERVSSARVEKSLDFPRGMRRRAAFPTFTRSTAACGVVFFLRKGRRCRRRHTQRVGGWGGWRLNCCNCATCAGKMPPGVAAQQQLTLRLSKIDHTLIWRMKNENPRGGVKYLLTRATGNWLSLCAAAADVSVRSVFSEPLHSQRQKGMRF